MSSERFDFANLELLGGAPCLDLINTFDWRGRADRTDYLTDYTDLTAWAVHAGLLKPNRRKALQSLARNNPSLAEKVFGLALELREAGHRMLTNTGDREDVALVNNLLDMFDQRRHLVLKKGDYSLQPLDAPPRLDEILEPILDSLINLLTSEEGQFVKACADEDCGWLFLDTSRNHSRRWCDMADCGNRAKAARFYQRQKGGR